MAPYSSSFCDDLHDGRGLLADGHVDADLVLALLVDDGVDDERRLAGLAVADDELALAAADGDHGVDGLDAGLQRLLDGLALDDARGLELDRAEAGRSRWGPCRRAGRPSGSTTRPTRASPTGTCRTRPVRLTRSPSLMSVSSPSSTAPTLSSSRFSARPVTPWGSSSISMARAVAQAVDAGDAVADLEDGADLVDLDLGLVVLDLCLEDRGDLFGTELHSTSPLTFCRCQSAAQLAGCARARCRRR